jgi:uncharacterized membrane protein YoaK (UPF0700 family)
MKLTVPVWLSINAGYVDTAGFLALQGLFTAHVTGNFVTLGAALVHGTSGVVAKLLALPVFCIVILVTRLAAHRLPRIGLPVFRTMLTLQVLLLVVGGFLATGLVSSRAGDETMSTVTGMALVAAMAIQNAASRIHLGSAPPTTLMTGTTTQIMIDVADLVNGVSPTTRSSVLPRLSKMLGNVAGFAIGCAAGALFYSLFSMQCFAIPPLLAVVPIFMPATRDDAAAGA